MAIISGLYLYPVKSCGGISLPEAELAETGLRFDRHWMVIDRRGKFVTQRDLPGMARIVPHLAAGRLVLSAPGTEAVVLPTRDGGDRVRVTVWGDQCFGLDQGDAAARWLSAFLGEELRLVRFDRSAPRRNSTGAGAARTLAEFADGHALLVISEASLADLNNRLALPLPMNRFRPNIVIAGIEAYEEDHLRSLKSDDIELRLVEPCIRCQITMTDQDTGEVGEEPMRTLLTYRSHPKLGGVSFGQKASIARGAGQRLRIGQELEELWSF